MALTIPKVGELRGPIRRNPKRFLYYGNIKIGKTMMAAKFTEFKEDALLVDFEEGDEYADQIRSVQIKTLNELIELYDTLEQQGKPFGYGILDTVSKLQELAWEGAKIRYSKSSLGKSFNQETDMLQDLPHGAGYGWHRDAMGWMLNRAAEIFPKGIILIAHVKDAEMVDKNGNVVTQIGVSGKHIDLTGKLSRIIAAKVDTVGLAYLRTIKDGSTELWINFEAPANDKHIMGSRCQHLKGVNMKFDDWSKIYLPEGVEHDEKTKS